MGSSSSKPRSRSRPSTVSRSTYNSVVRQRDAANRALAQARRNLTAAQDEQKKTREMCGSSGSIRDKAREMFGLLEGRYIDRLALLETQQTTLNKQNVLLNNKSKKIDQQDDTIDDLRDKIHTRNRRIRHNLDDNKLQNTILAIMRAIFLIISIVVIGLLIKSMQK